MTESASRSTDSDPRFSAPLREGETVAGKYVVGRLLGLGGMGAVYEARDMRLERRVALKVLLPRLVASPTAAGRFKREAKAATRITSEHVVKVVEIDDLPDGTPFLVMEYLEGKDLRVLLRENGPLAPRQAVDYLLQALQADNPGDFALTSSEDLQLGSPTYMPPEQFQNPRDVDARADIWALGVTLYELVSGRVPFQGITYPELISQVLNRAPNPLQAAAAGSTLPAGLEQIVGKCLEKQREARYLNAVELAVALAPFGSDDARLSLTRVSGLSRPRTPTPTSSPRDSIAGYEATMPVPGDLIAERPHTESSSGARRVARRSRWTRASFALSVIAAAAIFGVLIFQQRRAVEARSVELHAATPRALSSSFSAAQAADTLPSTVIEPAKTPDPRATTDISKAPTTTKPALRRVEASRTTTPGAVSSARPIPSTPAPANEPEPEHSAAESSEVGHTSSKIDKLIEQRH